MVITDKPTRTDLFGFEPFVKGIADLVRQTKPIDLPIAIGIYGAWGSGKTSFIMQLEEELLQESPYTLPTVWFDAWKYDRTNDVQSALIYTILAQLRAKTSGEAKTKITKSIQKVINASKDLVLQTQVTVGTPVCGVTPPSLSQVISNVKEAEDFTTSVDRVEKSFVEAVKAYLSQYNDREQKKLVIFIDDLDRCLPSNVITVLEALKLFLDKTPCIFIIAIDRTVAEQAIQNRYGSDPGISGRDYLDKIIQYPFTLPPAKHSDLKKYIGELAKDEGIDEKCLDVFSIAAKGNPRTYLRLITSWKLYASLAPHVVPSLWGDKSKRQVIAIAIALHLLWPELHEKGRINPSGLINLTGFCFNKPSTSINQAFTNSNAIEYLPFWENGTVHNFLHSLTVVGQNTGEVFGSAENLKAALELCARNT